MGAGVAKYGCGRKIAPSRKIRRNAGELAVVKSARFVRAMQVTKPAASQMMRAGFGRQGVLLKRL